MADAKLNRHTRNIWYQRTCSCMQYHLDQPCTDLIKPQDEQCYCHCMAASTCSTYPRICPNTLPMLLVGDCHDDNAGSAFQPASAKSFSCGSARSLCETVNTVLMLHIGHYAHETWRKLCYRFCLILLSKSILTISTPPHFYDGNLA